MTTNEIIISAFQLWLASGCKTYGERPEETAKRVPIYVKLLADVDPKTLEDACGRCANTCEDFPSVANVREAVAALRDEQRALPERKSKAHEDCVLCDGTGWEPVCDGVQRCRCTKGLEFPVAQERKQLGDAEFRELMAVAKGRVM